MQQHASWPHLDEMVSRFGSTPLMMETPRGGFHLWYRHAGETSVNLRHQGIDVDVNARGGVVLVPPSFRPSGAHAGKVYRIRQGSWTDRTKSQFSGLKENTDGFILFQLLQLSHVAADDSRHRARTEGEQRAIDDHLQADML